MARLSRRVGAGFHGSGGWHRSQGRERAGHPGFGSASSLWIALVITSVQGQWRANLRCRRRAVVTSWAAAEKRRSRSRRGSQSRGLPVSASIGIHGSKSRAI